MIPIQINWTYGVISLDSSVSIYLNKNNSKRNVLVQAFYELVKNNLYPIDEWRLFFVEA